MKTFVSLLLIGWLAHAGGRTVRVDVHGMVCSFCAQGITKKLKAETGVESVEVKLEEKRVTLRLKDDGEISDDRIRELLTEAGYNVQNIQRD